MNISNAAETTEDSPTTEADKLAAAIGDGAQAEALGLEQGAEEGFTIDSIPETGILPKGIYRAHCLKAEPKISKNGNLMFVADLEILSPESLNDAEGKPKVTAGTKFKKWFVWPESTTNPAFKRKLKGLCRAFGIPTTQVYRSTQQMQDSIMAYLSSHAKGSTFLWELYTEPVYKRELLTTEEINAGKRPEEANYVLDHENNKILERHEVRGDYDAVIGAFERRG